MKNVWEALTDSTRREILVLLKKEKSLSAGEIYEYFDITKPSLSHHLAVLKEAGLVTYDKKGQSIIYSLNFSGFSPILEYISSLKK